MIRSFRDRRTADFCGGNNVRQFSGFRKVAERKLVMLGSAVTLGDLAAIPEINWKNYRETGLDNTVSGSTINGGSALLGRSTVPMTWKSWTITERH